MLIYRQSTAVVLQPICNFTVHLVSKQVFMCMCSVVPLGCLEDGTSMFIACTFLNVL